jgi:hypothetical protein
VVFHLTLSLGATGSDTGVLALVVETCEVVGALVVILTLPLLTEHEGVALEPGGATAGGCVPSRDAVSIGSTRVRVAGVRTFLTPGDSVRHGNIAGETLAHRVPKSVHLTLGVGSTWRGEARVWGRGPRLNPGAACDSVWLWREAGEAGAHRVALPVDLTLGVRTTWSWHTWVWTWHTLVVLTHLVSPTVWVPLALPATPCDSVWLGHIAG